MSYWQGKVALITGGSAGLGFAIAETLGGLGASVMLAARDDERLQSVVGRLQAQGFSAAGIATDVTDSAQVEALVAGTIGEYGRLDLLVNNVGRSTRGNVLDTSPEEFRDLMELNFLSVVRCTQSAMPHVMESRGHIVNIGSLASKSVSKFLGAYPASKFAVAAYSQQLRLELNSQGVHVLLVCPGPIARDDAGRRYDSAAANLPEAARKPGGGIKLRGLSAHELSSKLLRSCELRRAELIVPWKARWLFAVSQVFPSIGDWFVYRYSD